MNTITTFLSDLIEKTNNIDLKNILNETQEALEVAKQNYDSAIARAESSSNLIKSRRTILAKDQYNETVTFHQNNINNYIDILPGVQKVSFSKFLKKE